MKDNELKEFLDFKANQYESSEFIKSDPIQIPHQFSQKEDIEITAFLMATIAWGNRKSIIANGHKLLAIMGNSPYDFVMNYDSKKEISFVHRTFNSEDLDFFFRGLNQIYKNGGLEKAFSVHSDFTELKGRIYNFRTQFLSTEHQSRTQKHVSNPMANSACKRLIMFLRWMVRDSKKGVDFGIWNSISASELYIPLDVHTGNIARKLGLLSRTQNDWTTNEELILKLREFDSEDPAKYDFALFGLGAFEKL
ncbi:MAG: TIGR02757 family protein [Flavobacteriales bacterium]|nr:TIGR02757 family protein [Crocinitomicaceae bacterium]NBX79744.1 TIGR02757 family protein [Flavobacteriales bacterium]